MLAYNKERDMTYEREITKEEVKALGNEPKSFWIATHRKDGQLQLERPTEWQEW